MRRAFFSFASLALAVPAFAGHNADSTIWTVNKSDNSNSGWVVSIPAGSNDYFDNTVAVVAGTGNVAKDTVAAGLRVTGTSVSVADFGSGRLYPTVGTFNSNLAVDTTGNTPDLASAVASVSSPSAGFPPATRFDFYDAEAPEGTIPSGATKVHAVVQFPPGDSGLLGVGGDTGGAPGANQSGFTTDGYATPSITASFIDWGLGVGQDNTNTTSTKIPDLKVDGRLRASNFKQGIGEGDLLTVAVKGGDTLNLAFFGHQTGDKLRLYFNVAPCTPAVAIGPVLPTIPDGDGDGTFIRINAAWPSGFGGQTFRFSAVWGNPAYTAGPGVGFTNCVTVVTAADPTFGVCDDGTVESGWVVSIPAGSSDAFNNDLGNGTGLNLTGLTISVLDFVAASPYPQAGASNANFGVDPSGHSPDTATTLALVAPFTFPSGTFATTSGAYVSKAITNGGALGTHVHAWVQFPPGDSGFLGVGADTTASNGCSYFTQDLYASPAISFFTNWGLRLKP